MVPIHKAKNIRPLLLASTLFTAGIAALTVYADSNIPIVVSAYNAASTDAGNSSVSATVTLTNNGATFATAYGKLAKSGDVLTGKFPLSVSDANVANKGTHTLEISISKSGRVGLQWMMNGQPYAGAMRYFQTDSNGNTLSTNMVLQGETMKMVLNIKRKLVLLPEEGGKQPTPTPKPMVIITKPLKFPTLKTKKAVGRYLKIVARFVVTNSDDGIGDHQVEMDGDISLSHRLLFRFDRRNAKVGDSFDANPITVYQEYGNDNPLAFAILDGRVVDHDGGSGDDMMWTYSKAVDIRALADSQKEQLFKGDRDSESGDIYLRAQVTGEKFENQ